MVMVVVVIVSRSIPFRLQLFPQTFYFGFQMILDMKELCLALPHRILRSHSGVPPTVVPRPQPHVPNGGLGKQGLFGAFWVIGLVQWVQKHFFLVVDERPNALCILLQVVLFSLFIAVVEKRPE